MQHAKCEWNTQAGTHTCRESEQRGKVGVWCLTVVECDDVEDVHQLSLVLVDPLHLHVKQGLWVDLHSMCLLKVLRKTPLVLLLDTHNSVTRTRTHEALVKHGPMGHMVCVCVWLF